MSLCCKPFTHSDRLQPAEGHLVFPVETLEVAQPHPGYSVPYIAPLPLSLPVTTSLVDCFPATTSLVDCFSTPHPTMLVPCTLTITSLVPCFPTKTSLVPCFPTKTSLVPCFHTKTSLVPCVPSPLAWLPILLPPPLAWFPFLLRQPAWLPVLLPITTRLIACLPTSSSVCYYDNQPGCLCCYRLPLAWLHVCLPHHQSGTMTTSLVVCVATHYH